MIPGCISRNFGYFRLRDQLETGEAMFFAVRNYSYKIEFRNAAAQQERP